MKNDRGSHDKYWIIIEKVLLIIALFLKIIIKVF